MSAWKDSDEVTTTYGSIQLSLEQAHAAGIKTEQQRIIKVLQDIVQEFYNNPMRLRSQEAQGILLGIVRSIEAIKEDTHE